MKPMTRRLILIVLTLILLGVAAFFYIDTVFLPVQFKRFVTTRAERLLRRKVSIGAIDFRPVKGFIVENITVARKDAPHRPFIQVKQATFNLLLVPVFQKKAVIIPGIKIKEPAAYLIRHKNGEWNFSDLLSLRKTAARKSAFPVLLRKLDIEGGEIHYTDQTREEEFFESVEDIRIGATLSLNKGIRVVAEARVPKRESMLKIKGNYGLSDRKLTAQILLRNVHLARYLSLAPAAHPYIRLADGVISSAELRATYENRKLRIQGAFIADGADLRVGEDKQMTGAVRVPEMLLTWRGRKWDAKGRVRMPSVRMTAGADKEFRGDVAADLNLLTVFGNNMTAQGNVTVDNARLRVGEDKHLSGNISAVNASLAKQAGTLRLQGNFDIKETAAVIGAQTSLNGNLSTMGTKLTWSPDGNGTPRLDVQTAFKLDAGRIAFGPDASINGNISAHKAGVVYEREKITAEAHGQINATDIRLPAGRHFQGNPYFNVVYRYDPQNNNPVDYKGTVHLTKSLLTGVPLLEEIRDIEGIVAVMPDHVQTDGLTFNTQGTNVRLSGLLTGFAEPLLNIEASSDKVDLQKVLTLFPALHKKIQVDLTGQAAVRAAYRGPARSPDEAVIELTAQLDGAAVSHKKLPDTVTDVSGRIDYKKDLVAWDDLRVSYGGKLYTLNGRLNNFARPVVDLEVASDQLALAAQIKILHQAFQFTSFAGDYLNSSFNLKGDVHFFEDAPADVDLRGKFALDLRDVGILVPRLKNRAGQLRPAGILAGEGIYKGKLNDWRNWQLALNAQSDKARLGGYPFENVSVQFAQRDMTISKCSVSSRIYGGELNMTSSADLRGRETPFTSTISLTNLDLARLREDQNLKNRQLAGTLSLSSTLEGTAENWRQLTGKGSLNISNGYIWQWNILKGISGALLIPEFKNIVFTEGRGDFIIRDQKIFTNNARMSSKTVTLDGEGWIAFDKSLNFNIIPTFSELAILRSGSMKKGLTSFLTQTEGYLNIRLRGTLDDPQYKVETFPIKILKGTTDILKEGVQTIFEEIF